MNNSDVVRFRHMLDAAREAISFARGRTREDLHSDRLLLLALVKEIEIIGEAASRVSSDGRAVAADTPWAMVIGIGNRLIHAYFDLDLAIVWSTLTEDLPHLILALERVLSRTS